MGFLTDSFNQKAVYWGTPTSDGRGGWTFADPVEIDCRWEQRNELFRDDTGQEKVSAAVVFVDRDMVVGGRLFLGRLSDIASDETPENTEDSFEIRAFRKIPDLDGEEYERKVFL